MQAVIGILGAKGAGKDTAALFLTDTKGYARIGFADALYQEVADAFGVTVAFLAHRDTKETPLPELALVNCRDLAFVAAIAEEMNEIPLSLAAMTMHRSPRWVLQYWGTEYRRKRGVDGYWLDKVDAAIKARPLQSFVITDVRFKNEAKFVERRLGVLVRVRRPAQEAREAQERAASGAAAHGSETEMLEYLVDYELINQEGNPDSLKNGILGVSSDVADFAARLELSNGRDWQGPWHRNSNEKV